MQCPRCGAANPDDAEWCQLCLERFAPSTPPSTLPPAPVRRRDPQADAFARTGSVTLQRLHDEGPLVYLEPGGLPEATVMEEHVEMRLAERADALLAGESLRRLDQRHTCVTLDGVPLFSVERYRAVTQAAFTVADADGAPLAIYLPGDAARREVELRDGTGAPVAAMRREHGRFNVHETGGTLIAQLWREDNDLGRVVDDRWGLTVFEEPRVLKRLALVAAPLVCWLLWYRGPRPKTAWDTVLGAQKACL